MECKVCSIFGHSEIEITKELEEKVFSTIEKLINRGVDCFYFGGLSMFDDFCHDVVSKLKEKYPHIKRIFCLSDPRHQRRSKRPRWLLDEDYEEIIYLSLSYDYWFTRIYYRNCEMINLSDIVLFYVEERENSGAYKAYKYAKKMKKEIINLF